MATTEAPAKVALVAMGASARDYLNETAQRGGRGQLFDEVWAINAMGQVIQHDRLFAMDPWHDLVRQVEEGKKVARGMVQWLPEHPGPVYMPEVVADVPGAVRYPIEDVLHAIGFPYLNTSVACAVAYALHIGVGHLCLYGCDFTYPDQHVGEAGRGCVEWLLGMAAPRGMDISVSPSTTLMDARVPRDHRLYGYDGYTARFDADEGRWRLVASEDEDDEDDGGAPEGGEEDDGEVPRYIGGGCYELPGGEVVRGKAAARRAVEADT